MFQNIEGKIWTTHNRLPTFFERGHSSNRMQISNDPKRPCVKSLSTRGGTCTH